MVVIDATPPTLPRLHKLLTRKLLAHWLLCCVRHAVHNGPHAAPNQQDCPSLHNPCPLCSRLCIIRKVIGRGTFSEYVRGCGPPSCRVAIRIEITLASGTSFARLTSTSQPPAPASSAAYRPAAIAAAAPAAAASLVPTLARAHPVQPNGARSPLERNYYSVRKKTRIRL